MTETTENSNDALTNALAQSVRLENKMQALQIREMKRKSDRQEECRKRRQLKRIRRQALIDSCQARNDEYVEFAHHIEHNEAMQRETMREDQLERERLCTTERDKSRLLCNLQKKIKLAELEKDYELDSFSSETQKQRRKHEQKMERMMLDHRKEMIMVDYKIQRLQEDYEFVVKFGVLHSDEFFEMN